MNKSLAGLTKRERRLLKKQEKAEDQKRLKRTRTLKRIAIVGFLVAGLAGIGYFFSRVSVNQQILPPIDIIGHSERNPAAHILDEPMPLAIQKHMLEHADGGGPPGIIINYNCEDYLCESDFIEQLKKIVEQYPQNVYLAPFKNMSAKLVLTKLSEREILEEIDQERIRNFIEK